MDGNQTDSSSIGEIVWRRHSNPKSGWSRLLSWPLFVMAIYFRKRGLALLVIVFGFLNPVLFSEPDEELDSWMYRVVQAEKRWMDDGNQLIGIGYPQLLNSIGLMAMIYGLFAAYQRRAVSAAIWTITGLGLGQWCMKVIIENYEQIDSQ